MAGIYGQYKGQGGVHGHRHLRGEFELGAVPGCAIYLSAALNLAYASVAGTKRVVVWRSFADMGKVEFVNPVDAEGPELKASDDTLEGRPTLSFDRTVPNHLYSNINLTIDQPFTLVVVMKRTGYAGDMAEKSVVTATDGDFAYQLDASDREQISA